MNLQSRIFIVHEVFSCPIYVIEVFYRSVVNLILFLNMIEERYQSYAGQW